MSSRKENFQDLKELLQILIDNIEQQFIILNKVKFNRYSNVVEIHSKKMEAKHTLKIGINFLKSYSNKENNRSFVVIISYLHEEELYSVEEKRENIAVMQIEYILNLIVKPSERIKSILSNEEVLRKYAEGTGLLTIYPYIRHTANILHREARIFIPPYPLVKVRPPV